MVLRPAAAAAVGRRPGDRRSPAPSTSTRPRPSSTPRTPQAAAGRLPDVIPFEVYCHSLTDPSILGPVERATGLHTLTLFGLHTPARAVPRRPGGHPARRRCAGWSPSSTRTWRSRWLDCLARDADGRPCLQAASPLDVEASLAMPGGHIFHGDLSWPVAATTGRRSAPGASPPTHPRVVAASSGGTVRGGAVSGLGGFAAAQHLLDLR